VEPGRASTAARARQDDVPGTCRNDLAAIDHADTVIQIARIAGEANPGDRQIAVAHGHG